jgi:hypothetical protein
MCNHAIAFGPFARLACNVLAIAFMGASALQCIEVTATPLHQPSRLGYYTIDQYEAAFDASMNEPSSLTQKRLSLLVCRNRFIYAARDTQALLIAATKLYAEHPPIVVITLENG